MNGRKRVLLNLEHGRGEFSIPLSLSQHGEARLGEARRGLAWLGRGVLLLPFTGCKTRT